jgi:hypothetical protein
MVWGAGFAMRKTTGVAPIGDCTPENSPPVNELLNTSSWSKSYV